MPAQTVTQAQQTSLDPCHVPGAMLSAEQSETNRTGSLLLRGDLVSLGEDSPLSTCCEQTLSGGPCIPDSTGPQTRA